MRQTREVLLIILAVTVGFVVWTSIAGLLVIEMLHPDTETWDALGIVWNVAALMLGVVFGFIVGRKNGGS